MSQNVANHYSRETTLANAKAWEELGIKASETTLKPEYGPVWAAWSNPNYVPFVESFETAEEAVDTMCSRITEHYYPMWYGTTALVYGNDPEITDGAYPIVELSFTEDNDIVLTEVL